MGVEVYSHVVVLTGGVPTHAPTNNNVGYRYAKQRSPQIAKA